MRISEKNCKEADINTAIKAIKLNGYFDLVKKILITKYRCYYINIYQRLQGAKAVRQKDGTDSILITGTDQDLISSNIEHICGQLPGKKRPTRDS